MENLIYVDELNIDENLKCDICKKPFIDPVSLPCEQTFCLKCIQSKLQDHLNNCLQCNQNTLTEQDFKPEGPRIRKILDNLLVKCLLCDQQNIQRINFTKHIEEFCPKRIVVCRANDIKCPWKGPFNQLDEHFNKCPYEQIRTDLTQLINDNQHLKQRQTDFNNLENHSNQQENNHFTEINQLNDQNRILNERINRMEEIKIENQHLNEQSEQQLNEINKLKNENNLLNDKIKQIKIENEQLNENCIQQLNEINHLKSEYKLIEDQFNQYKIQLNNFDESSQTKQNNLNLIQIDNQNLRQQLEQQQIQIQSLIQLEHIKTDYQNLHHKYQQQQTQIQSLLQLNQQLRGSPRLHQT